MKAARPGDGHQVIDQNTDIGLITGWHPGLFLLYPASGIGRGQQALREGKWKAVRYGMEGEVELYNLEADPGDFEVLGALDAVYRGAQRWHDLVGVLRAKVEAHGDPDEKIAVLTEALRDFGADGATPASLKAAARSPLLLPSRRERW